MVGPFHHIDWSFQALVGLTWLRVIEAVVKGAAFAVMAVLECCLARRKDNCFGKQRMIYAAFWAMGSIQAWTVAGSLYFGVLSSVARPGVGIVGAGATLLAWVYAVYRVGEYPEQASMLAEHSKRLEVADKGALVYGAS